MKKVKEEREVGRKRKRGGKDKEKKREEERRKRNREIREIFSIWCVSYLHNVLRQG